MSVLKKLADVINWIFEPIFADEPSTIYLDEYAIAPPSPRLATRWCYAHDSDNSEHTYIWRFNRDTSQQAIREINSHAELGLISWDDAYHLTTDIIDMDSGGEPGKSAGSCEGCLE